VAKELLIQAIEVTKGGLLNLHVNQKVVGSRREEVYFGLFSHILARLLNA
jgi:hypothetical protein